MTKCQSKGVLALGDSFSQSNVEVVAGIRPRPVGAWVACANDLPFHKIAASGYTVGRINRELVPQVEGEYVAAIVTGGANDLVQQNYDPKDTAEGLRHLMVAAASHARQVVALGLPGAFTQIPGIPSRVRARVPQVNQLIHEAVESVDGSFVDLSDLAGPRFIRHEQVHLTGPGNLVAAMRAARALGMKVPVGDPYAGHLDARTRVEWVRGRTRQVVRQVGKRALRRF